MPGLRMRKKSVAASALRCMISKIRQRKPPSADGLADTILTRPTLDVSSRAEMVYRCAPLINRMADVAAAKPLS